MIVWDGVVQYSVTNGTVANASVAKKNVMSSTIGICVGVNADDAVQPVLYNTTGRIVSVLFVARKATTTMSGTVAYVLLAGRKATITFGRQKFHITHHAVCLYAKYAEKENIRSTHMTTNLVQILKKTVY